MALNRKVLIVVLDGVGDFLLPPQGLEPKDYFGEGVVTPCQRANKPVLDGYAKKGQLGTLQPIPRAPWSGQYIAPQSDAAVLSLLGVDVFRESQYTGRGPVECFAEGLYLQDGDLMLRGNFATLNAALQISDRRAGRVMDPQTAKSLCDAVNLHLQMLGFPAHVKPTSGHRCLAVIRDPEGKPLSGKITAPDPAYVRQQGYYVGEAVSLPANPPPAIALTCPMDDSPEARRSAELVNRFVYETHVALRNHPANQSRAARGINPANVVLVRDAGATVPRLPSTDIRYGAKMAVLAEMPVECGIALMIGMGVVPVDTGQGKMTEEKMISDYTKFREAVEASIEEYDGLYVHIKGPDLPGHDGEADLKTRCIELIDTHFFQPLKEKLIDQCLLAVTGDHSTPCPMKGHSSGPVPLLVWHPGITADAATAFDEVQALAGSLAATADATLAGRQVEKGALHGPDLLALVTTLSAK